MTERYGSKEKMVVESESLSSPLAFNHHPLQIPYTESIVATMAGLFGSSSPAAAAAPQGTSSHHPLSLARSFARTFLADPFRLNLSTAHLSSSSTVNPSTSFLPIHHLPGHFSIPSLNRPRSFYYTFCPSFSASPNDRTSPTTCTPSRSFSP
jgi:hypothetical protein